MQSSMQQPTLESRPEAQALKPGNIKVPIYLDNHATTPVDPRVLDAMLPYFSERFGNAASRSHSFGWEAERAVERAREQVARLIGASPKEIVFTSGATESDNLAIKGIVEAASEREKKGRTGHIVTQATEHKAVLDCCHRLEESGVRVTVLPVNTDGIIDLQELRKALDDQTTLVTIMFANNEIGTIQPVADIGALCSERGIPFHTDAVQAAGKIPIDVEAMNIDALSLSAHKMYGPKGVGALYIRHNPRLRVAAQIDGGGHERGFRSGTLNVPAIVGMGEACEIALREREAESRRIAALRDRLKQKLEAGLTEVHINGTMEHRLPGNLNVTFRGVDGEALLMALDDIALSSGSACTSAAIEPSYVLRALGLGEDEAESSIRFGIGRFNTEAEIDYVANRIIEAVRNFREISLD
jgi:cysteine desulfurase